MSYYPQFQAEFARLLAELAGQKIVVLGHQRPDGDCVGSQVALCRVLRARGLDAICVNPDAVPRRLRFLVGDTPFFQRDAVGHADRVSLFVDCADHERAGEKIRLMHPQPLGCVDHHRSNPGYARFNFVDPDSAAAAEMLAGLFLDAGLKIDATTAQALFTGIMTDTGQFRFASTSQRVFRLAAELLACGADPSEAGRQLYENDSTGKMRLLAHFLGSLRMECGGRVCLGVLPDGIFEQVGASVEETEGLVDYPRSIEGVEIGVLIEVRPGVVKASLRSKHADYRMDTIAAEFGGGGHANAAGLNHRADFDSFYPRLVAALTRRIAEVDAARS